MNTGDCVESERELSAGSTQLHCQIARPKSPAWARLLIVHGYGEHIGRYLRFMRWIAGRGVICEGIDLRGHGRSAGRRGFIHQWDEYLADLQSFLECSRRAADADENLPLFLLGHSHGGLISAAAGERGILTSAGILGCILSSPYLATRVPPPAAKRAFAYAADKIVPWLRVRSNLKPEWLTSDPEMLAEDRADDLMNRSATPRWFFTMRLAQKHVINEAAKFAVPLLCLTGEADLIADPSTTADFYLRASSTDKSLYTYPARWHELLREVGREVVFADILTWLKARTIATNP